MIKEDKGFTLVEVLAALTILGIVFIGFMTVFPQMTKFNEKTEDKLVTMNLAKQELAKWQDDIYSLVVLEKKESALPDDPIIWRLTGTNPNAEIDVNKKADLNNNAHEDSVSLHKIHIKIKKEDKIISETFGYIKVK